LLTVVKQLPNTYGATGNKLRRVSPNTGNIDYIGGIQYDGTTTSTISFIHTEEGRALVNGTGYNYEYNLGDNLGNTRVSFDSATGVARQVQQDDYYPFGMEINRSFTSPINEYLYNKKELQEETQTYDYGFRRYDPVIARWTTIDPLAELIPNVSPNVYVVDNPIILTDPNGLDTVRHLKEVQITAKATPKAAQSSTLVFHQRRLGMAAVVLIGAKQANAELLPLNAPFKPGTTVSRFKIGLKSRFVRVFNMKNGSAQGQWMAREEDIEGLTPEEIQAKFALKFKPDSKVDVNVPAGTKVEAGTVNENFGQPGGGTQFRLMEENPNTTFENLQTLPGAIPPEENNKTEGIPSEDELPELPDPIIP
jgi:RHS repeat-associated protein